MAEKVNVKKATLAVMEVLKTESDAKKTLHITDIVNILDEHMK